MNKNVKFNYNPIHKKWICPDGEGGYRIVHSFTRPDHAVCEAPEHFTHEMECYIVKKEGIGTINLDPLFHDDKVNGALRRKAPLLPPPHIFEIEAPIEAEPIPEPMPEPTPAPVEDPKPQVVLNPELMKAIREELGVDMKSWVVPNLSGGYKIVRAHAKPQDAYCEAPSTYGPDHEPFLLVKTLVSGGHKISYVDLSPEYEIAKKVAEAAARIESTEKLEGIHSETNDAMYVRFHNHCNPLQRIAYAFVGPRIHRPGNVSPFVKLIFGKKLEGFTIGGRYEF